MNLDLIQKLIRLANNNPNDNEANLAARKACKMLEDYKFPSSNTTPPKNATYGEQTRNNGPSPFNSGPPNRPGFGFDFDDRFWEEILKQGSRFYRKDQGEPFYKSHTKQEKFYNDDGSRFNPLTEEFKKPSQQKEERELVCVECKEKKKTKFVGLPECYICNECQWTMYTKHKK